jgi:predicted TIM-barrel fold metal-dependent hydrolase
MSTIEQTGTLTGTPAAPYTDAIDVHHHIVPGFYRRALADGGVDSPISGVEYPEWRPEASLEMMQHQGIATAMVSLSVPGVGLADPRLARRLARQVNEYMAELIASHPGRFGAFAALPLPDVDATLEETGYALDELGLDGVGLFTNYGRVYLGDASLDPIVAEIARRGAVAFVHPAAPHPQGHPHVDLPDSVCEFPFATTRMAAQMLYNGTFDRHPGLRLILPHAGGAIPFLAERLTFAPVIRPDMAGRGPADPLSVLRSLYYDTAMSGNAWTVAALRAFADSGHILIGTDFPFMPEWSSTRNGHQLLRAAAFTGSERRGVFRGNAEALFPRLGSRDRPEGPAAG